MIYVKQRLWWLCNEYSSKWTKAYELVNSSDTPFCHHQTESVHVKGQTLKYTFTSLDKTTVWDHRAACFFSGMTLLLRSVLLESKNKPLHCSFQRTLLLSTAHLLFCVFEDSLPPIMQNHWFTSLLFTEKSTVPDGATEQDRVLEDDGQPRSESLQRQLGDVDVINHNPSCVTEVYKNTPISPIKTLFLFFSTISIIILSPVETRIPFGLCQEGHLV